MARRPQRGTDDRSKKTASARITALTAALAEVADRPELVLALVLVLVLGIAGERTVGGTYDGEAVDEVLAEFSAYLAAPMLRNRHRVALVSEHSRPGVLKALL